MKYPDFILLGVIALLCSCTDTYKVPQSLNMGYLYDSLQYEQERWGDCGVHDTTNMGDHRFFCSMMSYVPYCNIKYASMEIEEVIRLEGCPQKTWIDTLQYGFKQTQNGEWFFPFVDFYDQEEEKTIACQALSRIQNILNHPSCVVQTSIWEDGVRHLRLHSLVEGDSNQVFWGRQGERGIEWLE